MRDRLLEHTPVGTKPAAQACALTGNRTGDLSLPGKMPNQLRHGELKFILLI